MAAKPLPPFPVVHLQAKLYFCHRFARVLHRESNFGFHSVRQAGEKDGNSSEETREFSVINVWQNHVSSKSWLDSRKTGPIQSEINRLFGCAIWILGDLTCCGTDSLHTVSFFCNRDPRDIPNFSFCPRPKTLSPSLSLCLPLSACLPLFY